MGLSFFVFAIILASIDPSFQYSFEEYENAILTQGGKCSQEYFAMDTSSQIRLFDASAKLPDGFLQGHINNLGAYDECIGIEIPEEGVFGKYCYASVPINDILNIFQNPYQKSMDNKKLLRKLTNLKSAVDHVPQLTPRTKLKMTAEVSVIHFGLCMPHHCDNNTWFTKYLNLTFDEHVCSTRETYSDLSTSAKIAIYILLVFVAVAIISTIYDLVRTHYEKEPAHDILISFSLYTNGRKLCQTSNNPNQLLCLNGLKTINMFWVVVGHYYGFTTDGPMDNTLDYIPWLTSYANMIVTGATVSVDSFFTISGLLMIYTLLRSKDPGLKSNIKGIPLLYVHRYLRLTPAFAIMIYLYLSGLPRYFSNGPLWYRIDEELTEPCNQRWWAALLYFQNYADEELCLSHSWYLSVDMQLFLLSPLVWIPLRQWPNITLRVMYGLAILGMAVPFGIGYYYELPATLSGNPDNNFTQLYYFATHARFGPFVVGMLAGYFIYHAKQRGKVRISRPALVWLWTIILGTLYACVYAGYPLVKQEAPEIPEVLKPYQPNNLKENGIDGALRWQNALYLGLCRPVWSIALSLLIYLCVTGNGGVLNWFLSTPFMQFMAKLSYCMYLNHVMFLKARQFQERTVYHFGNYEMLNRIIDVIVISIPISIVHTLLFESPMIIIEKIIFGKNKPKISPRKTKAGA